MKKSIFTMLAVLLSGLLMVAGDHGKKEHKIDQPWQFYLSAQEALAGDKFDTARAELKKFATVCPHNLTILAMDTADAENINTMRNLFKPLSAALAKMDLPLGVNLAYCPMADNNQGAHWLQRGDTIANPYFGSKMLRCGTIQKQ